MDYIEIKGYKSFECLEMQLHPVNMLIGANGAGKSNFLSFFEMLGFLYNAILGYYVAASGWVDKFLHQGRKITERIDATLANGQNFYSFSLLESDGRFVIEHEKLGYSSKPGTFNEADIASYAYEAGIKTYSGMKRGDYIKNYLSQISKYHFHDTGRKSPFTSECSVQNDSYMLYPNGQNLASVLYRTRNEEPFTYKRIISIIQSVAPYFNDFNFEISEAGMLSLKWKDKYCDMTYGATDFSDGTIRFIALVVLFLQPHLPQVIIIDEPELGLHPKAIEKLSGLIHAAAKRGTQIIAATQSAELISHFEPHEVLTVDQNDQGTTISRLNNENLQHWLNDYSLGELWKQSIIKGGQPQ